MSDAPTMAALPENIYGHAKRLDWIADHLNPTDRVLEFGCGTGYMIVRPLLAAGYRVRGIDLDAESIAYGKRILEADGLPTDALEAMDLAVITDRFDAIIASEVLEHLSDEDLDGVLGLLHERLVPGGRLLVTVPNGYGWFELEAWLWKWTGLGWLVARTRLYRLFEVMKQRVCGDTGVHAHQSTLSSSPHLQRFNLGRIRSVLESAGFAVTAATGTVLFAGPLSNMLWSGCGPIMRLNNRLGDMAPRAAVAFMLAAVRAVE